MIAVIVRGLQMTYGRTSQHKRRPEHNRIEEYDNRCADVAHNVLPPSTVRLHCQELYLAGVSSADLFAACSLLAACFRAHNLLLLRLSLAVTTLGTSMVDAVALPFCFWEGNDE